MTELSDSAGRGQVTLFVGARFLLDGELRRVIEPGLSETDDGRRWVHLARPDGAT